jgi:hypothetical protein
VWYLLIYPALGLIVTAYIICKDSRYLFVDDESVCGNMWLLFFSIWFWPLAYMFALGDSMERQKKDREKK